MCSQETAQSWTEVRERERQWIRSGKQGVGGVPERCHPLSGLWESSVKPPQPSTTECNACLKASLSLLSGEQDIVWCREARMEAG